MLMLHCQLRRGLLGTQILHARGLSGHTSLHGHHQLRQCSDIASFTGDSSVLGHRCLRRGLLAPRCSVIDSDVRDSSLLSARSLPATPGTPRSSVLGHRQLRWGLLAPRCSVIDSDARDSSLLGAWSSPAMLRTPCSSVLRPPIRDGTHSLSRRAPALAFLGLVFFDLAAPFFAPPLRSD